MKEPGAIAKTALRLAVCAILMAWIFHSIFSYEAELSHGVGTVEWSSLTRSEQWRLAWTLGPTRLWQTIRLVDPVWFILSLFFMGATVFIGTVRWMSVLAVQGIRLPVSRAIEISLVAHFFNSFLLGSTGGDVLKAYYAARETHHKKTEAVTAVFVDRLLGLLAMLGFAAVSMIPYAGLVSAHRELFLPALLILCMFVGFGSILAVSFWGGLSRALPRARGALRTLPKGEVLERAIDASRQFGRSPAFLVRTLMLSTALNAACVLQFMALSRGLEMQVPAGILCFAVPTVICIAALPITPSGLGVRENLFVVMLCLPAIGAAKTQALSLSLLAYAGSLFWSLIGGLVYLYFRQRHHLDRVAADADSQPPATSP